jgi:hypothetical protein
MDLSGSSIRYEPRHCPLNRGSRAQWIKVPDKIKEVPFSECPVPGPCMNVCSITPTYPAGIDIGFLSLDLMGDGLKDRPGLTLFLFL